MERQNIQDHLKEQIQEWKLQELREHCYKKIKSYHSLHLVSSSLLKKDKLQLLIVSLWKM